MINHSVLHRDGSPKIYVSSASEGQYLYFTGAGDDIINNKIGEGDTTLIENPQGLDIINKEIQFLEDIQLKNGLIFWENAVFGDYISVEIILPKNTPMESPTNQGNVNIIDGTITPVTSSSTVDETWTGTHIVLPIDFPVVRFVNKMHLFGSNTNGTILESLGVALIKKTFKIRLTFYSPSKNTNIKLFLMAEVFRRNTI